MRQYLDGDDWQLVGWYRNQWRFTRSMELGEMLAPDVGPIPATVPGAVQADLLRAGVIDDPRVGTASRAIEWTNNREWFLQKRFDAPQIAADDHTVLVCEGLDPAGEIHLNDRVIGTFDSMMIPVAIDVTEFVTARDNLLRIVFFQTPEIDGQYGFTNRIPLIRSRFGYVWDWCPRMISTGAWQSVYLDSTSLARLRDPHVVITPADGDTPAAADFHHLSLSLNATAWQTGTYQLHCTVSAEAEDADAESAHSWNEEVHLIAGEQVLRTDHMLPALRSWWPAGMGAQARYRLAARITDTAGTEGAAVEALFGARTVELLQNPDAPAGALGYTMAVNGEPTFQRGVNWVPLSPWFGTVSREQYRRALVRFREMGCNILRVWGGAILETPTFYDLCDELGLLVWQEFPQSSSGINNEPNSSPEYIAEMRRVAQSYIERTRIHPSLSVWCGGNELMDDDYRPVDSTHPTIAVLAEAVHAFSPEVPFLPASPSGPRFVALADSVGEGVHHDVHGPWTYDGPTEHYRLFNTDDSLLRTETGAPGHARLEALDRWSGGMPIWPPRSDNPYWRHRGAWWIAWDQMEQLFGPWDREQLSAYISLQRYTQAEALRYAAESARRRAPACSGFLVWMGNEPFPNASNTSVIEYDLTPKPAHALLSTSFAPTVGTASYDSLAVPVGRRLRASVFIIKDARAGQTDEHRVAWTLHGPDGRPIDGGKATGGTPTPREVGHVDYHATEIGVYLLRVALDHTDRAPVNEYLFCVTGPDQPPLSPLRDSARSEPRWALTASGTELRVWNPGRTPAYAVFAYGEAPNNGLRFKPNLVTLLPGEERRLAVTADLAIDPAACRIRLDWINR